MEPNESKPPEQPAELAPDSSLESAPTNTAGTTDATNSLETSPAAAPIPGEPSTQTTDATPGGTAPVTLPAVHKRSLFGRLLNHINIYLLIFIILLVVAGLVIAIAYVVGHGSKNDVQTQSLTEATLKQLANSDVTVGQPKQVLNVQSNAVFAGKVLVRDGLEVAGALQVGGSLNLPNITVSDTAIFGTAQVQKNLNVASDGAIQGQLTVQKNLSVAGGATFGGAVSVPQLTASSLNLSGDLNLTHHISAGGATPGRSNGTALGSGGSASVSGSDTAGSININTGSGAAAGCFVTVNFVTKFNATPHVLVTPVGSAAGNLGYYVNRSTTSFSVCAANVPPSGTSFGFDYFVLD